MSYDLLRTMTVLSNTVELVSTGDEFENAGDWLWKKFGLRHFQIRMHWGVVLLGTGRPRPTSESVILVRDEHRGLLLFYRANFMKELDSAGFLHCVLGKNNVTVGKIRSQINNLFLRISAERNACLYGENSELNPIPVCPQARVYAPF